MRGFLALITVICLVTAMLDMGMNGTRDANWAPWGLGISIVCFTAFYVMGGR